jgi:hypothetical protein
MEKELDSGEFRLFVLAAMDMQRKIEAKKFHTMNLSYFAKAFSDCLHYFSGVKT